ncbi:MAG: radical SAM protein [Polyangia bacterium]|jgi:radical SAM superfamily enzyme YgiQ (UPF0313 family)|nr:radical SAM protein [Polyangia bacterium]
MKSKVVLGTFSLPHREWVDGNEILAHPSFYRVSLAWIEAMAKADPEISVSYDLLIESFWSSDPIERSVRRVWSLNPKVIALSCNISNLQLTLDFSRRIRLALPDAKIVLGGPEAYDFQFLLKRYPFIDVIVLGEGEVPFAELLRTWSVDPSAPLGHIVGIAYRDKEIVQANPGIRAVRDLSLLPSPYSPALIQEMSDLVLYATSRGCPHACSFCRWHSAPRRFYPIDQVERELGAILANPKVRVVSLSDSEIDLTSDRTRQLLEFIRGHNVHQIKLRAFFDFLGLDSEVLQLSRDAGFLDPISIGLQSCSPRVLEESGRRWYRLEQLEDAVPVLSRFYPKTKFDIIYGLPGDSYDGFVQTLRWCLEHGLGNLVFHRLNVLPGTAVQRNAEKVGLVYDREAPHYVYAANSFTYADLLRMEDLAVSFQVFMSVFLPEDYGFLRNANVDFLEIMERAPKEVPNWTQYFKVSDNAYVWGLNLEFVEPVLDLIRSRIRHDEMAQDFAVRIAARRGSLGRSSEDIQSNTKPKEAMDESADRLVPSPSSALMQLAERLLAPWQVGKPIKGGWKPTQVALDSTGAGAISYIFEWDGHPLHMKVVPRDDAQPRLSHSRHFNIFYSPQPDDEDIPAASRQEIFSLFVSLIRRNDTSSETWPWPRGDGSDDGSSRKHP